MQNLVKKTDFLLLVLLITIFLFAIFLRFNTYIVSWPLWHDEAPVALTVINNDFLSILNNVHGNQKAPVIFWFAIKFFGMFFDYSELSLRFYPFICGIASIFVFYFFSKQFLNNKISLLLANFMFAVNYPLILFSTQIKQYSGDILFFMLAIWGFGVLLKKDLNFKTLILSILTSMFFVLASFPASFVVASYIFCKAFFIKRTEIKKYILYVLITAVFSIVLYKLFFMKVYSVEIDRQMEYWKSGFLTLSGFKQSFINLYVYFFQTNASYILGYIFSIFGLYLLHKEKNHLFKIVSVSLSIVLIASVLKIYPLYARVATYLIPLFIIFICKMFDWAILNKTKLIIIVVLYLISFPNYFYKYYYENFLARYLFFQYDGRSTLQYIKDNYKEGDKIILSRLSGAIFKYYSKRLDFYPSNSELYTKEFSKEAFVEYINSQDVKGNIWFYVAYPIGIHQLETEMISQWREENLNKIKEEYYIERSFVIKI